MQDWQHKKLRSSSQAHKDSPSAKKSSDIVGDKNSDKKPDKEADKGWKNLQKI